MFKKKLIALAGVAVLAMGISSQASADPILSVTFEPITDAGGGLTNFVFSIGYACDGAPATCPMTLAELMIDLSFLQVLSIDNAAVSFLSGVAGIYDIFWQSPEGDFEDDGLVSILFDPLMEALDSFVLTITADCGIETCYDDGSGPTFNFWDSENFDNPFAVLNAELGLTVTSGEPTVSVPEPGTLGLLGIGLLGIGAARRRRRKIA